MDYYEQKAKRMYDLFLKNEPCKKAYGVVKKSNKYFVIENAPGKKWKYQIAGGSVEQGESCEQAILREIAEELNINAKIVKKLGTISYQTNWKYLDKEFSITNQAEIFLLDFVSFKSGDSFGVEGEFSNGNVKGITLVSKKEVCANVYEFADGKIKW